MALNKEEKQELKKLEDIIDRRVQKILIDKEKKDKTTKTTKTDNKVNVKLESDITKVINKIRPDHSSAIKRLIVKVAVLEKKILRLNKKSLALGGTIGSPLGLTDTGSPKIAVIKKRIKKFERLKNNINILLSRLLQKEDF